jgi:Tfp pilus assembly protein PilX
MWLRNRNDNKILEAEKALREAEESLQRTKSREPEVQEVVLAHRVIENRNHFAIHLRNVIGGQTVDKRH